MKCVKLASASEVLVACNAFEGALQALNDQKAIDDTSSMFHSIKAARATYDSRLKSVTRSRIWVACNDQDRCFTPQRDGSSTLVWKHEGRTSVDGGASSSSVH